MQEKDSPLVYQHALRDSASRASCRSTGIRATVPVARHKYCGITEPLSRFHSASTASYRVSAARKLEGLAANFAFVGRQPSRGGTSRMTRECQVRICEGLGVQFPGPTRHGTQPEPSSGVPETLTPYSPP